MKPFMFWIMLITGLGAAFLYLHKDADVEQRIDKREAIQQRDNAEFDRDFSRANGDKEAVEAAKKRIASAQADIELAEKLKAEHAKNDQRKSLRESLDDTLKPEPEETAKAK